MATQRFYEVSAEWMQACGFGDSARVFPVLKINDPIRGLTVISVDRGNGLAWDVIAEWRGMFVDAPETVPLYKQAFPDFDHVLPVIPGMADESWRNDICPVLRGDGFELWCDYADASKREFEYSPRFSLNRVTSDDVEAMASENDFLDIVRVLIACRCDGLTQDEMRAWLGEAYAATVGYNPFEDDAAQTVASVSEMLAEMLDIHFRASNGEEV